MNLNWRGLSFDGKCKMIRFSDIGNMNGFDGKLKVDYTFKGKIHLAKRYKYLRLDFTKLCRAWQFDFRYPFRKRLNCFAVDKANRLDKMNLHLTACEIDKEYIDKAINEFQKVSNKVRCLFRLPITEV
jgi:hypothetical protein